MPNASWRRRGVATARGGGSPTLATERSESEKGGAKRRAAQAKRGSLGKLLAGARGRAPLSELGTCVTRQETCIKARWNTYRKSAIPRRRTVKNIQWSERSGSPVECNGLED